MPVTARLSKAFYDRFGETVTNELVDWFNAVDATYRSDLREVNELNFARFDAKLEQRFAVRDARIDMRFAELDAKFEGRFDELDAKFDLRCDALDSKIDKLCDALDSKMALGFAEAGAALERRLGEQTRFFFVAWSVQLAAIVGLWFRH